MANRLCKKLPGYLIAPSSYGQRALLRIHQDDGLCKKLHHLIAQNLYG